LLEIKTKQIVTASYKTTLLRCNTLTFWTHVTVLAEFLQDLGKTSTLYSVTERKRKYKISRHCDVVSDFAFYR